MQQVTSAPNRTKKTRTLSCHPQMIYNLISAQAGSLSKAVLENIMNSIDAHATEVIITVNTDHITIQDDGHGFRTFAEIQECFEVFGFPHEEGARTYGKFGIGRAQLWSFASAKWRTNEFVMDVDIRNRGLDYDLDVEPDIAKHVSGLLIEAPFYTQLTTQDLLHFKEELRNLAQFAQIPVIFNGEKLNTAVSSIKWDYETADAFIKLNNTSLMAVYNLGVLVRTYPSHAMGSGGMVVTKPGVQLALNMARNDILVSECKVWSRIKPYIQAKSDEKVKTKKEKLNSNELENRARRYLTGDLSWAEIDGLSLVTDITNRSCSVSAFMSRVLSLGANAVVTSADAGSPLGERAHSSKLAYVVHPDTIARFGFANLDAWYAALKQLAGTNYQQIRFFKQSKCVENFNDAVPSLRDGYSAVPHREYTKKEQYVLAALGRIDNALRRVVGRELDGTPAHRTLSIGLSDAADAWTDSKTIITLNKKVLKRAEQGLPGMFFIVNLIVHEYLHDVNSVGTHIHDELFYQRFHEVMFSEEIGVIVFRAYKIFVGFVMTSNQKLTARTLEHLTFEETVSTKLLTKEAVLN